MKKIRVLLLLLVSVVIVGFFPGSFFRAKTQTAPSSGGGNYPDSTTVEPTKIYCVVEQGEYIGLSVEVWENGEKLAPIDELDGDDPHFGGMQYTGFDVYEVTPGQSEVRLVTYTANQEKKSGEIRAGSRWIVLFDEDNSKVEYFTSSGTVSIPASSVSVFVYYSHL